MPSRITLGPWLVPFEAVLISVLAGEAFSVPNLAVVSWVLLLPLLILAAAASLLVLTRRMILLGVIGIFILVTANGFLAYRAHISGELSYSWLVSLLIVPLNVGLIFLVALHGKMSKSYEQVDQVDPRGGKRKMTWLLFFNAGLCVPFATLAFYTLLQSALLLFGYGGFLMFDGSGPFFNAPVPPGLVIGAGFLAFQAGVLSGSRMFFGSTSLIVRVTPILQFLVGLMIPVSVFLFVYPLWFPILVGLGLSAFRWRRAFAVSNHFV